MHWKKPLAVAGVVVVLAGGGVAYAAAVEPAKAYGGCVNKNTGYLRVLERNNLAKSVDGKCRSTERKITWYSRTGAPKGPKGDTGPAGPAGPTGPAVKSWSWTAGGVTYTCSDPDGDLNYACASSTPSPSPSPSPTPTPSAT